MAANVFEQERGRIDLCLDLKMEPKALEGIWVCASSSDPGRRRGQLGKEPKIFLPRNPHLATLQESAGSGASWLTHLPRAELPSEASRRGPSCLCL